MYPVVHLNEGEKIPLCSDVYYANSYEEELVCVCCVIRHDLPHYVCCLFFIVKHVLVQKCITRRQHTAET